jgi:hypothetical protein
MNLPRIQTSAAVFICHVDAAYPVEQSLEKLRLEVVHVVSMAGSMTRQVRAILCMMVIVCRASGSYAS